MNSNMFRDACTVYCINVAIYKTIAPTESAVGEVTLELARRISNGTDAQWRCLDNEVQVWYDGMCSLADHVRGTLGTMRGALKKMTKEK